MKNRPSVPNGVLSSFLVHRRFGALFFPLPPEDDGLSVLVSTVVGRRFVVFVSVVT